MATNRQFLLRARPEGRVKASDFTLNEAPVPKAGPGQAVLRTRYLSLDPTNRVWMSDVPQYMPPVAIGEVMRGAGIGEVVDSQHATFATGDFVLGLTGWQDYVLVGADDKGWTPIPKGMPIETRTFLGLLGVTGLTAWFGLMEIGKPKPGETVVVSAAAGAVGSVAGQLAKIAGCRVVGIAGGPEKCAWLTGELGFDAAVDYKAEGWVQKLKEACPKGVDVDFENVGGDVMNAVLARMNHGGRVVLCGLISGYNDGVRAQGPFDTILMKRLTVQGFIILDYQPRYMEGVMSLAQHMMAGKLKHHETLIEGLEKAPDALNMLFDGKNRGKLLVRVS